MTSEQKHPGLRERLIQLTRDLVLIESTDDRPEERRRCFHLIRNHLDEVPGIEIQMLEKNGYESLLALPVGVDAPDVLFCAHLDVVHHPEPESYRSEVRDGRIYGPGAGDMKGQVAIMIELMRHFGRENPGLRVGLAITSDEERGGENGVRYLVEEVGLRCGGVVIPDGGSIDEIIVAEKGILHLRLTATGESAHAARPWFGVNALENLTGDLARIRAHFDKPDWTDESLEKWITTCTLTMLSTPNDSPNRIPEVASAVLDVRFIPPQTIASMLDEIRGLLSGTTVVEPIVSAESTLLAPDESFIEITGEVMGEPSSLLQASGGSDGRFFSSRGIPVMLSRPRVGNLHGRDEWIEIDSMLDYFEICRRYALEKCGA